MSGCPPSSARRTRSMAFDGAAIGPVTAVAAVGAVVLITTIVTRPRGAPGYNAPRMANPEHARLLLTPDWNDWRVKNPNVTPDLTGADLTKKDLSGKDLKRADLTRADLSGATAAGTDFTRAPLLGAKFGGMQAPGPAFHNCAPPFLASSPPYFPPPPLT